MNAFIDCNWRDEFVLVETLEELDEVLCNIADCDSLAIDLEGSCLSRYGKMCTLQIGLPEEAVTTIPEKVFVLDLLSLQEDPESGEELQTGDVFEWCSDEPDARPLKDLLEDSDVVKYFYDCRMDSDALFAQAAVELDGVVDLQLAEVAYRRMNNKGAKYLKSLSKATEQYLPAEDIEWLSQFRTRTAAVKQAFEIDPEAWELRPLTEDQILYAAIDVAYMHTLAETLYDPLTVEWASAVNDESRERARWYRLPDDEALSTVNKHLAPEF